MTLADQIGANNAFLDGEERDFSSFVGADEARTGSVPTIEAVLRTAQENPNIGTGETPLIPELIPASSDARFRLGACRIGPGMNLQVPEV